MISSRFRNYVTWLTCALLILIVLGGVLNAQRFRGAFIDDSFITFRHSLNLVRGHGFSCNAGERIEGTSAPLFSLLIAPFLAFGADPYDVASLIGTTAFGSLCVLAFLIVQECIGEAPWRWSALGSALIVASSAHLAFHSQTGMETTTSAAVVMLGLLLHLRNLYRQGTSVAWAIVMGLGVMLRTEVAMYFLAWLVLAQLSKEPWCFKLKRTFREIVAFCIALAPLLAFRLSYFGTLVPNSVVAKSGKFAGWLGSTNEVGIGALLHGDGTDLLRHFATTHSLLFAMLPGCLLVRHGRRFIAPVAMLALGGAALVNWSNGDWMPNYRHLVPCMAPLAAGVIIGIRGLLFRSEQRGRLGHFKSIVIAGTIVLAATLANAGDLYGHRPGWDIEAMRALGRRLSQVTTDSEWLVTDSAGILPYYWGINLIDSAGLCNAHIARNGEPDRYGIGRKLNAYVASLRPDWYAFEILGGALALYEMPEFAPMREDYLFVQYPTGYLATSGKSPHLQVLLVRKDKPGLGRVASTLGVELIPFKSVVQRLNGNGP